MSSSGGDFEAIEATLKKAAAALRESGVPFALGGSLAAWIRGGPASCNDLDLMVKKEDAERALRVLVQTGMRAERPPEGWLLKAWDGEILIDLIFEALGVRITDEALARADELSVFSVPMLVLSLEDVIASKLLALSEHDLDYEPVLTVARAVREQVDWHDVGARTSGSPYARAFFALMEELGLGVDEAGGGAVSERSRIRVVPEPHP
jgi:hypothetical protein